MTTSPPAGATSAAFRCALVVPTYNAADGIDAAVARLRRFVRERAGWRVLFVCDGCTDGTDRRLARLIRDDGPALLAEAYPANRGKGYAVRRGLSLATEPYRFFLDVDLAYDPDEALKLLAVLEGGADLAAVNRANVESRFLISPRDFPNIYKRHLMSRAFNWWLRRVLPIRVLDTQAGLKGITGAAWDRLAPRVRSDGFFIDVELLVRAAEAGMSIGETPVVFSYVDPTTVRMISHGSRMIVETLRLRRELARAARYPARADETPAVAASPALSPAPATAPAPALAV